MKFLFFIPFCIFSFVGFSQSESLDYVFDSEVFQGERKISVFVPDVYNSGDSTDSFAVAYLFDGQFQPYYSMVSSVMSYYSQTNEGVPLIIVGIHTTNRWGEFVPVSAEERSGVLQGADQLTEFLRTEVIPLIEANYRTKAFKIGIGHSLGGTFVINEMMKEDALFDAGIAASPNLRMYDEQIIHQAEDFYASHPENAKFIYAGIGTKGDMELDFKRNLLHLDSVTATKQLENMTWKCEVLNGKNHMTTFVPVFDVGYLELSKKLTLMDEQLIEMAEDESFDIVEGLTMFYKELSVFTKQQEELTIKRLVESGSVLARYQKYQKAKKVYQTALDRIEGITVIDLTEIKQDVEERLKRVEFNILASKASQLASEEKYREASELYIAAFNLEVIRATHIVRLNAISTLAQAGEIEQAFVQLDLLANKFQLGGNQSLVNDPLCKPLYKDKRWGKLMGQLKKNEELYR